VRSDGSCWRAVERRGITRRVHLPDRDRRSRDRPARELRELDARAEVGLRRRDGDLPGLRHLGLREALREPGGLPSANLTLDDAQNLLLKRQDARGEARAVALHQRPMEGRMDVAVHGPAQLLDLGVGEVPLSIGGREAQCPFARDEELLGDAGLDVHPGAGDAEAGSDGEADLRVGGQPRCRGGTRRRGARSGAASDEEHRRAGVGVGKERRELDLLAPARIGQDCGARGRQ